MFAAKVVEVTLTHKFQGTSMRQPALRFVLTGAPPSFSSFVLFFFPTLFRWEYLTHK